MRNLENMLKNKAIECNKLVEYGFKKQENKYIFKNKIYNKQFEIVVIISDKQKTSKLIDLANDEEYIMVDIQDCAGKFVGEIRQEYEKTIQDIINKCTIDEIYKNQQSKEVIKYIKEKSEEKKSIKISVKDLLEDPFKNIRKDFTEKGEYLATITGYTDNGIFANIAQGVDTVCILPTWLDRPPFPGEKVIIKIYKIIPEKRKIYSSLIKIMGSDASE